MAIEIDKMTNKDFEGIHTLIGSLSFSSKNYAADNNAAHNNPLKVWLSLLSSKTGLNEDEVLSKLIGRLRILVSATYTPPKNEINTNVDIDFVRKQLVLAKESCDKYQKERVSPYYTIFFKHINRATDDEVRAFYQHISQLRHDNIRHHESIINEIENIDNIRASFSHIKDFSNCYNDFTKEHLKNLEKDDYEGYGQKQGRIFFHKQRIDYYQKTELWEVLFPLLYEAQARDGDSIMFQKLPTTAFPKKMQASFDVLAELTNYQSFLKSGIVCLKGSFTYPINDEHRLSSKSNYKEFLENIENMSETRFVIGDNLASELISKPKRICHSEQTHLKSEKGDVVKHTFIAETGEIWNDEEGRYVIVKEFNPEQDTCALQMFYAPFNKYNALVQLFRFDKEKPKAGWGLDIGIHNQRGKVPIKTASHIHRYSKIEAALPNMKKHHGFGTFDITTNIPMIDLSFQEINDLFDSEVNLNTVTNLKNRAPKKHGFKAPLTQTLIEKD